MNRNRETKSCFSPGWTWRTCRVGQMCSPFKENDENGVDRNGNLESIGGLTAGLLRLRHGMATILYATGFIGGMTSKSIDTGPRRRCCRDQRSMASVATAALCLSFVVLRTCPASDVWGWSKRLPADHRNQWGTITRPTETMITTTSDGKTFRRGLFREIECALTSMLATSVAINTSRTAARLVSRIQGASSFRWPP